MSKLMRIGELAAEKIESLSKLTGLSKQKILDRAITFYAHEQILKKANEQYAALKKDSAAWKEMQEEFKEWSEFNEDGLKDD